MGFAVAVTLTTPLKTDATAINAEKSNRAGICIFQHKKSGYGARCTQQEIGGRLKILKQLTDRERKGAVHFWVQPLNTKNGK